MSDISLVTNFFSTANEGFTTTLASTISAGASTVPLNNTAGVADGTVFVGIIEPGATSQQVFTGTVNIGSAQISNVVWTRGTNVGHASGVTIVDYVTGTDHNMATVGILKSHNQDGTPKSGVIYPASTFTTPTITDFTNAQHTHANAAGGGQLNKNAFATGGLDNTALNIPYKFSGWLNSSQTVGASSTSIVAFDTELFDTGSNFDTATNKGRFTAPVAGFYHFDWNVGMAAAGSSTYHSDLYKNGSVFKAGARFIQGAGTDTANFPGSALIQMSVSDYVEVAMTNTSGGGKALTNSADGTYFMGYLISST